MKRNWVLDRTTSADQIHDSNNDGQHQENVDQAPCNVKSPAKKPKNNENGENSPKHGGTRRQKQSRVSLFEKQVLWIQVVRPA